jgi:hypothetical protein
MGVLSTVGAKNFSDLRNFQEVGCGAYPAASGGPLPGRQAPGGVKPTTDFDLGEGKVHPRRGHDGPEGE